jgi:hypothetical protein
MGRVRTWVAALCALAAIASPAAAQPTADELREAERLRAEGHAIVDVSAIWPALAIEVCWELSPGGFEVEKALVRRALREHIEANSGYTFPAEFGACDGDQRPRIRVQIDDSTPRSEVGFQRTGGLFPRTAPTRMWLNFTFANWSSDFCSRAANSERCITFIAVHEFMHALGIVHEQLHPDVARDDPACFARFREHNRNDVHGAQPLALTRYSPTSAMNYCWDRHYLEGVSLSDEDKISLRRMTELTRQKMR